MKKEGIFASYVPPSSQSFADQFKEKDALITPWRILPISILYNTELVKAADAPKSLEDLLSSEHDTHGQPDGAGGKEFK